MSDRSLTSGMLTAIAGRVVTPVLMAFFDFGSGPVYLFTGTGTFVWAGNTYVGTGKLAQVTAVEEVVDNSARSVSFTLGGIPSDLLALALTDVYQGRACKMWLGCFDSSHALIADPYQILGARMDVMIVSDGGTTGSIALTVENRLVDLGRTRERRYTDQDQKAFYPTDKGLQYIAGLQDKTISWGSKPSPASTPTVFSGGGSMGGRDGTQLSMN